MMAKIIVTGTPGSGKTTVLKALSDIRVINMGTEMLKYTADKNITNRDEIRKVLSYSDINRIRKSIFEELNKIDSDFLFETHTSVKKGSKYIPGFSDTELRMLKEVKAIIYIDATAGEILLRRQNDSTRERENETEEDINEQRSINIALASYFSACLNVPLYMVRNRQNMVSETNNEVRKAITEAFSAK